MSKYNIIKESEVTDEKLFHNRRKIIKSSIAFSFFTLSNLLFAKTEDLIEISKKYKRKIQS